MMGYRSPPLAEGRGADRRGGEGWEHGENSPFCRICNPTANKISGFTIRLIRFLFYWITNPYNNCVWIANPDELSGKAGSIGKILSPFCRICNPTANKISGFTIRLIWFLLYRITNPYNNCVWIANPDELSTGKTLSPFCRICNPTANKISGFTIRLIRLLFYRIQILIIIASGLQIQTN